MVEFQGNRISEMKDPGCWRLCHVQTSGCMATERRTDEQREQQQIVLDYATDGGCDVAGLGDATRRPCASATRALRFCSLFIFAHVTFGKNAHSLVDFSSLAGPACRRCTPM